MALIHYLINVYGLQIRPGKKHHCPVCHNQRKTFSVKKDATLAKCFKCGIYMIQTGSGIYDSSDEWRPAA